MYNLTSSLPTKHDNGSMIDFASSLNFKMLQRKMRTSFLRLRVVGILIDISLIEPIQ